MLKHIKIATFLVFISLIMLVIGITQNTRHAQIVSRGNYFFENTRKNTDINSIVLKFSDNKQITLEQKNHMWRVKEADDYYADFQKINSLIRLIRGISIYRADSLKNPLSADTLKNAFELISYDIDGHIVDDAQILPKEDKNKFHYALLNHQPILYQLNGDIGFSPLVMDWVKMPILELAHNQIKRIKTDDFTVFRRFENEELMTEDRQYSVPQIKNLTQHFWALGATDIKHAVHFDKKQYKLSKTFEITMLDGIIYQLKIYTKDNEYWLNIQLDKDTLITPEALIRFKENGILYDGWFFKINSSTGSAIANFIL